MQVSIIIPVYNDEQYLDRCLSSLLNQTMKDIEIIMINDGSTDNSLKLLKQYERKSPLVKVFNQSHKGEGYTKNRGIKEATGTYITFINAKDFIDETFIYEMLKKIKEDKSDIVYCNYYEYYNYKKMKLKQNNKGSILSNPNIWGKVYKKSFLLKTNLTFINDNVFSDISIVPLLMGSGKCSYLPLPLYYHNKLVDKVNDRYLDIFEVIDETIYNFKKKHIYTKYEQEIEYIYLKYLLKDSILLFLKNNDSIDNIEFAKEKILGYFPNILGNKYYLELSWKEKLYYEFIINTNPTILKIIYKIRRKK